MTALPTCLEPGAVPIYPPVTVAEHLAAKLGGSRAGTTNPDAAREAARVLAALGR